MYAIVEFSQTKEVAVVPLKWVAGEVNDDDLVADARVDVHWPPFKSTTMLDNAVKRCSSAQVSWPVWHSRILGTAGMYGS